MDLFIFALDLEPIDPQMIKKGVGRIASWSSQAAESSSTGRIHGRNWFAEQNELLAAHVD